MNVRSTFTRMTEPNEFIFDNCYLGVYSFDTPFSEKGLYVSLTTLQGNIHLLCYLYIVNSFYLTWIYQ